MIVIGPSPDQALMTFEASEAWGDFQSARKTGIDDSQIGRILAAAQAVPDIVLAGSDASKRLMEVVISGDLTAAANGVGYRAFAMGKDGISQHARLFDASKLNALIDAAAIWRIASVVVAQKHLHDINVNLEEIKSAVNAVGQFQKDQQRNTIEANFDYLCQIEPALRAGERANAVRQRLEDIESILDAVQKHLYKQFLAKLQAAVTHNELVGTKKLTSDMKAKIESLNELLQDYVLASQTRSGALQMLSLFPGEPVLKQSRAESVLKSILITDEMQTAYKLSMEKEIGQMKTLSEPLLEVTVSAIQDHPLFRLGRSILKLGQTNSQNILKKDLNDNTLTPRLNERKKSLISVLTTNLAQSASQIKGLHSACASTDSLLLQGKNSIRYLIEYRVGVPVEIREVRTEV